MKGAQNRPPDALSHFNMNALHMDPTVMIDFEAMAVAQEHDPELVRLKSSPSALNL